MLYNIFQHPDLACRQTTCHLSGQAPRMTRSNTKAGTLYVTFIMFAVVRSQLNNDNVVNAMKKSRPLVPFPWTDVPLSLIPKSTTQHEAHEPYANIAGYRTQGGRYVLPGLGLTHLNEAAEYQSSSRKGEFEWASCQGFAGRRAARAHP